MPLLRIPQPFKHPDWLVELKHDGFRALAEVRGHRCTLTSRNGNTFKSWPHLAEEIAHSVRANDARSLIASTYCSRLSIRGMMLFSNRLRSISGGRSNFRKLFYRREWPFFLAFDLLRLEGVPSTSLSASVW